MSRKALAAALTMVVLTSGGPAFAKDKHGNSRTGAPKALGHHCEVRGTEVDKAKKDCRKAGGVWMDGPPHVVPEPTAPPPSH